MTTPSAEQEREELAQWCENYASFMESGSDMARDETIFDEIANFRRIAEILRALTADASEQSTPEVTEQPNDPPLTRKQRSQEYWMRQAGKEAAYLVAAGIPDTPAVTDDPTKIGTTLLRALTEQRAQERAASHAVPARRDWFCSACAQFVRREETHVCPRSAVVMSPVTDDQIAQAWDEYDTASWHLAVALFQHQSDVSRQLQARNAARARLTQLLSHRPAAVFDSGGTAEEEQKG
jgi:hypothetical protein